MTLAELLEIDATRIPAACRFAMTYLERRWQELASPTRAEPLQQMLDDSIDFCTKNGVCYPKIVLLRLKQLQRREWSPSVSCTAKVQ